MAPLARRHFLAAAGLAGAATVLPRIAAAAPDGDPAFRAMLDRFADRAVALSPISATLLGLDGGPRAALKSRMDDLSEKGRTDALAAAAQMQAELRTIDPARLSGQDRTLYDAVGYALDLELQAKRFAFGGNGYAPFAPAAIPYVISQQNGAYNQIPEFLDAYHGVSSRADADAYMARLALVGPMIDAETARIRADAANGVVPPAFILQTTARQLEAMRAVPAGEQKLVASIAARAKAKGLGDRYGADARTLTERAVIPALDRQLQAVRELAAKADDRAGVWKLPDGDAYYQWALRCGTTTGLSADAIHGMGLEQSRQLMSEMDGVLRAAGMSKGTVGERLSALTRDPKQLYPNTKAGRAEVIRYVEQSVARLRAAIPAFSRLDLKAPMQVKQVPADIEAGAPLGYASSAALDGSRPAIYYINLADTGNWPRYTLTTLSAHEGIPGHVWQGAYLAERADAIPTISSLMAFNAYVEGWALYSEQLADEVGIYKSDPLGRLGMLQAFAFRAARLVVDTGLHAKRWTRAQAIQWMTANTGRAPAAVTSEVDRYCASPGQACGYKVGHNEIVRLRAERQARDGRAFDVRRFNDAVVATGGVPLDVLGAAIDRYTGAA